jgi:AraC family transcriptional regulator of adaptative response/methylated-DNA-[protein]-cysteine methyltransferase
MANKGRISGMKTHDTNYVSLSEDYQRIEQALLFLERSYRQQPTLEEAAASIGLSEYHFQRLFTQWVGISPKRFLQFLTKEHARQLLEHSKDVLDVAFESGLSGPGRLHDLFVVTEAVTPGEYKSRGEGLLITYGFHPTPFGECMVALTERGICGLTFTQNGDRRVGLDDLHRRWKKAILVEDTILTASLVKQIFPLLRQKNPTPLHIYLRGTNFQIKVWEALMHIPQAALVSYEEIATRIGQPRAVRAVSRAIAGNPIAVIIPCHRVIQKMGAISGYRWGVVRKKALQGWEFSRQP